MRTVTKTTGHDKQQIILLKMLMYPIFFLLVSVLFPILIWVGLFTVIYMQAIKVTKRIAYGVLFILIGISMPFLIWICFLFAFRHLLRVWREIQLPSSIARHNATSNKIKVLVVDDHTIVRDGIRALLEVQPDMQVIGDAVNGRDGIEKTVALHPNVVLMDILMPVMNGFEATKEILRKCPEVRVIMLSQYDERENILASERAGTSGFIPKKAVSSLLLSSIRTVNQNKQFVYNYVN